MVYRVLIPRSVGLPLMIPFAILESAQSPMSSTLANTLTVERRLSIAPPGGSESVSTETKCGRVLSALLSNWQPQN